MNGQKVKGSKLLNKLIKILNITCILVFLIVDIIRVLYFHCMFSYQFRGGGCDGDRSGESSRSGEW